VCVKSADMALIDFPIIFGWKVHVWVRVSVSVGAGLWV